MFVRANVVKYINRLKFSTGGTKTLDWMKQAELDAIASSKGKTSVQAGASPGMHMLNKIEHEFQEERVQHTTNLTEKLNDLIRKCNEHSGNPTIYNAIRKRALVARQDLIVQREASGMTNNQEMNTTSIEKQFPIPPMM